MKFRRVFATSIAAAAAITALAGCSGASGGGTGGLEKTNITVDAFPAIDSAGLFIAQRDGLFKAQGLNVTIKLAATSQEAIDGQLKGTYDISSADYVTYVDNVLLKKAPLRIVAESSFLRPNVLTLLVKAGSGVKSITQLRHRVISVNAPDDIGTLLIDSALTANGVALGDVTFNNNVPFPNVGKDLTAGKIDAAFAPEPFVSFTEMQIGAQELADLDQGGAANFPIQGVAATNRAAVEGAVEKFLQLPPLAASLISLPGFPTGVNSLRLQRLVDAMLRFGLLPRQYASFRISTVTGNG